MRSSTTYSTTFEDDLSSNHDDEVSRDPALSDEAPAADGERPVRWTPDYVGRKLVEAFRTLDRLPGARGPRAAGNHWPQHKVEWADQLAQAELPEAERAERAARRNAFLAAQPTPAAIAQMDQALDWLRELRSEAPVSRASSRVGRS